MRGAMNAVPRQAQLDSGRLPCPPQKPLLDIDVSLLFGDDSEVQIPDRADGGANNVEPCTGRFFSLSLAVGRGEQHEFLLTLAQQAHASRRFPELG